MSGKSDSEEFPLSLSGGLPGGLSSLHGSVNIVEEFGATLSIVVFVLVWPELISIGEGDLEFRGEGRNGRHMYQANSCLARFTLQ
jgi:hypothetical protein